MKRIFKIRLYRIQEFDLYTLYFDPVFDLRAAMTQAVTAFAEGRPAPPLPSMGGMLGISPNSWCADA